MQGGQARHFQPGPMKLGYDGGCTGGRSGVYLHRDALGPLCGSWGSRGRSWVR